MKIVVIGGSGLIGSKLVSQLRVQGHETIAASPNSGVNSVTGEGLAEAMKGALVVVDVSNAPFWKIQRYLIFSRRRPAISFPMKRPPRRNS
jgi:nucleoside-diphosphate-sugar epimerase